MSEPLEPMSPLSAALLEAERHQPLPGGLEQQVWKRLEATLQLPPLPPAPSHPQLSSSAHSATATHAGQGAVTKVAAAWKAKAVIGAAIYVLGAGTGAVVTHAVSSPSVPVAKKTEVVAVPTPPPSEPAPIVAAPAPEAPPEPPSSPEPAVAPKPKASAPHPAPVAVHAAPEPPPSPAVVPAPSSLKAEREQLDIARAALDRRAFADALAIIEKQERDLPDGQMLEERESLAIQCLANLGHYDAAKARAAKFEARFPHSLLLPAVRAVVESAP